LIFNQSITFERLKIDRKDRLFTIKIKSIYMEIRPKMRLGGFGFTGFLFAFGGILACTQNSEGSRIRQEASLATPTKEKPAISQTAAGEQTAPDPIPVATGPSTTIKYEEESFDFGMVKEDEHVIHVFKFKNTGAEPLVISNARGSCGCTVPTWPKEPIAPGAMGEIKVDFNSAGKPGNQSKRITVVANTNPTETFLTIQGIVRGKDQVPTVKGK
jgi:Protein of unknown function (DUF1573)